jgi:hypothetical protein
MTEEFATVDEAVAAVMAAYPNSALMSGLSGLYSRTRVYYDPHRHKVTMLSDSRDDTVKPVVYVDHIDGVQITDSIDVYDVLNDQANRRPFDGNTTDLLAAVDDVAQIYIESHMARLLEKDSDDERLERGFYWQLERAIEVLSARKGLLESVQLRFLRSVLEAETTPEGADKALDRLDVEPERLRDLISADQRWYQLFTFPLREEQTGGTAAATAESSQTLAPQGDR